MLVQPFEPQIVRPPVAVGPRAAAMGDRARATSVAFNLGVHLSSSEFSLRPALAWQAGAAMTIDRQRPIAAGVKLIVPMARIEKTYRPASLDDGRASLARRPVAA
jgi:hypothetical protein